MSVEELVKELRRSDGWDRIPSNLLDQSADKLEELAAENERLRFDDGAYKSTIEFLKAALAEKDKEIAALREALEEMLEPYEDDPCRHDHHGYCQAHFLQEDCCVARARSILTRNTGGNDA